MSTVYLQIAVILCCIIHCSISLTLSSLTAVDRSHAKKVLSAAFASNDVENIHYGAVGLLRLNEKLTNAAEKCKILINAASDTKATAETLYYATLSYKAAAVCQDPLPVSNIVKSLNNYLSKETNLQELYFASQALIALEQKLADPAKLLKAIQALLKKNDSLTNLGYYFHISCDISADAAKTAFGRIEDVLVQADEVDSKYLQYEGGLSTTALIVNGIFKLANTVNKPPPLTYEQTVKFSVYFLSRSYVQTPKGIANLLNVLYTLSSNKFQVPVAISLASNPSVQANNAKISVKVSDVLGNELGPVSVTADSVSRENGDVVVASKKKMISTSDRTVFELDLSDGRLERGMYKISVSVATEETDAAKRARFPAKTYNVIHIKVLTTAVIDFVDVGTVDADQTTQGKLIRVPFSKEAEKAFDGDAQQKIQMRFTIKDGLTGKLMTTHQAFVRFSRPKEASVIFIAEPDSNGQYRLDLDIGSKSTDFGFVSGEYIGDLIIGDAILSNPFLWKFARFNLKFSGDSRQVVDDMLYKPKSVIRHLFREPEKRPLRFVSDLFSLLAALPLLLLFIMWARLRVNISNINVSLWTLTFHLGLGAIFILFGLFWFRLNMFETVRYLLGVGLVTFFSGNRLLRNVSNRK